MGAALVVRLASKGVGLGKGRASRVLLKNILASFLRKADRDRRNLQYGIAGADVDRRDLQTYGRCPGGGSVDMSWNAAALMQAPGRPSAPQRA